MQRARQLAMLQGQYRLVQAGQTGGRLQMADIGFDRSDWQRRAAQLAKCLADRGRLRRVADPSAGPVRLDEGKTAWVDRAITIKPVQQLPLAFERGEGDAVRSAVGIDAGSKCYRPHRIPACD